MGLLRSIQGQDLPDGARLRVVVVDNDAEGSARETVESFGALTSLPLVYDIEPIRNISLARNRCLFHATADYVAFIDDDEAAEPRWLVELIRVMMSSGADAVFGPVLPVLPPDAPGWIVRGGFFERPRYADGASVSNGGTGNVLIRRRALAGRGISFSPQFGLTGGEDGDLFYRLRASGCVFRWCDRAVVREVVASERMTVFNLCLRALRGGQTHAAIILREKGRGYVIGWFIHRVTYVLTAMAATCLTFPAGRRWWVGWARRIFSNLGQLSVLTGCRYRYYATERNSE